MQIKTHNEIPRDTTRIAIIKKTDYTLPLNQLEYNKFFKRQIMICIGEDMEKLEPSYTAGKLYNRAAALENSLLVPQKN